MSVRKFQLPEFLKGTQTQETYERWLKRKAAAHLKRDRNRGNTIATGEMYRSAIHHAVVESLGRDNYTDEDPDWTLLSQYDNAESKAHRRDYKRKFVLLPFGDHVNDGLSEADFVISGWRTNDCKNDLTREELIEFCRKILDHAGT
ncbi:MAG: hypothetical protein ACJAW7_001609 [Candidatus Azotimanducaceae bacterium]|jgi:hypothetical protein